MTIGNTNSRSFEYIVGGCRAIPVTLNNGERYTFTIRRQGRSSFFFNIKNETGEILRLNRPKFVCNEKFLNCSIHVDASTLFFKCGIGLYPEDLQKTANTYGVIHCKVVRKENVEEGIKFIP